MTDDAEDADDAGEIDESNPISFQQFLEAIHPSLMTAVVGLWGMKTHGTTRYAQVLTPDIRLHCVTCEGERTFRCKDDVDFQVGRGTHSFHLTYRCGDCLTQLKQYSLHARLGEKAPQGSVYKYGELPAFGVPVPNKLLRLFGDDRDVFLKGRQCENQGLGIGAFAYYRRVVENHKNDIFDRIIKVCQTVEPQTKLIAELHAAKKEVSFFKAIEQIKTALPQGLLINGNNPLTILHSALSVGLHNESDDECLRPAHAVRLILTDLVQKMAILRQDGTDLRNAVSLLLNKQASKAGPSDPAS